MDIRIPPVNSPPRRWPRQKLDVPLRVVIHTPDKTVIRDGRASELSEGGMSFAAGVELKTGDQVEIEFTPAYSGLPIRIRAVARNGNGYKYGAEFVASNNQERHELASLRENLPTLSSSYTPSCSPASNLVRGRRRQSGGRRAPGGPTESATTVSKVSSGPAFECASLPLGSRNPKGKSRGSAQRVAQARSIGNKLGTMPRGPAKSTSAPDGGPSASLPAAVVPQEPDLTLPARITPTCP
jgi:PilZ domain